MCLCDLVILPEMAVGVAGIRWTRPSTQMDNTHSPLPLPSAAAEDTCLPQKKSIEERYQYSLPDSMDRGGGGGGTFVGVVTFGRLLALGEVMCLELPSWD